MVLLSLQGHFVSAILEDNVVYEVVQNRHLIVFDPQGLQVPRKLQSVIQCICKSTAIDSEHVDCDKVNRQLSFLHGRCWTRQYPSPCDVVVVGAINRVASGLMFEAVEVAELTVACMEHVVAFTPDEFKQIEKWCPPSYFEYLDLDWHSFPMCLCLRQTKQ